MRLEWKTNSDPEIAKAGDLLQLSFLLVVSKLRPWCYAAVALSLPASARSSVVVPISLVQQIGVSTGTCVFIVSAAVMTGEAVAGALIDTDGGVGLNLKLFRGANMAVGASLIAMSICAGLMGIE